MIRWLLVRFRMWVEWHPPRVVMKLASADAEHEAAISRLADQRLSYARQDNVLASHVAKLLRGEDPR